MSWEILQGDCIEVMAEMEEASVDAVVCDPPYGIGFMGHEWDQPGEFGATKANGRPGVHRRGPDGEPQEISQGSMEAGCYDLSLTANRRYQGWCEAWAREAFRVLKPGGHLLASCGARTYHRLTAGVEDAGFEIRDTILWLYGSGFPKVGHLGGRYARRYTADSSLRGHGGGEISAPATSEAAQWEGWGTALKPAHEPIVVARKPLTGTVAENVLEHGCGALNIDGCRIGVGEGTDRDGESSADRRYTGKGSTNFAFRPGQRGGNAAGRWPSNVAFSHHEDCEPWNCAPGCPVAELDAQSGVLQSGSRAEGVRSGMGFHGANGDGGPGIVGNRGGASRFFYVAKTSRAEKSAGLEGFEAVDDKQERYRLVKANPSRKDGGANEAQASANNHPTVKPINLMRWLVRLVTPPGGTCLDPFLGSGSTGCAAVLEGFDFIGIEREAEYIEIAKARIAFWAQHEGREVEDVLGLVARSQRESKAHTEAGQLGLEAAQT